MIERRLRATGDGRIVGLAELRRGELADAGRLSRLFMTVTLTDVIADVCAFARSLDGECRIAMEYVEGALSPTLDLTILGKDFDIACRRTLVRGWFPLNPFAAEFGANYDVAVTANAPPEAEARLDALLRAKYPRASGG